MSAIAEFSIPAEEFALGHLLEIREGVQIRLESMIPTGESVIPYFWIETPDIDAVEAALEDSPLVTDAVAIDRIGDEALFRVTWSEDVDGIIETITETGSVVLAGDGHGDHWTFQLRFSKYGDISTFYRNLVDKGISVDLEGIHNPVDRVDAPGSTLTEEQREAILIALREGYFEVPRRSTLVDLAEQLGISDSAVSQRIRRGLTKLLTVALSTD